MNNSSGLLIPRIYREQKLQWTHSPFQPEVLLTTWTDSCPGENKQSLLEIWTRSNHSVQSSHETPMNDHFRSMQSTSSTSPSLERSSLLCTISEVLQTWMNVRKLRCPVDICTDHEGPLDYKPIILEIDHPKAEDPIPPQSRTVTIWGIFRQCLFWLLQPIPVINTKEYVEVTVKIIVEDVNTALDAGSTTIQKLRSKIYEENPDSLKELIREKRGKSPE